MICPYASSGCNGPKEGECMGLCAQDEKLDQEFNLRYKALELLDEADRRGFNLTITREVFPLNPSMATATVDVWLKRGGV